MLDLHSLDSSAGQLISHDTQGSEVQSNPIWVTAMAANLVTDALFDCLGYVQWLGPQLQQLQLPGEPSAAAAALQELQQLQQLLQHALADAYVRLHSMAVFQFQLWSQQQQQQHMADGSSAEAAKLDDHPVDGTAAAAAAGPAADSARQVEHQVHVLCAESLAARLAELARSLPRPAGQLDLTNLEPCVHPFGYDLQAEDFANLVGDEVGVLLYGLGAALWSALPQPRCCNNWACSSLGSVSEAKLVARKASRCSKCKVAK
jgi:hypothetical protein